MDRSDTHSTASDRAVIDRLAKLRVILPALAEDVARARRQVAELRSENAGLVRRLAELQKEQAGSAEAIDS